MSVCLCLSLSVSVCLSVRPSVRPSVCLSVCLSFCPSVCPHVLEVQFQTENSQCHYDWQYLFICMSVFTSVCLSTWAWSSVSKPKSHNVIKNDNVYLSSLSVCLSTGVWRSVSIPQTHNVIMNDNVCPSVYLPGFFTSSDQCWSFHQGGLILKKNIWVDKSVGGVGGSGIPLSFKKIAHYSLINFFLLFIKIYSIIHEKILYLI